MFDYLRAHAGHGWARTELNTLFFALPGMFLLWGQVIDPEFAFYGPMGFDLGALIGNLLLAYCGVPGNGQGSEYAEWLLEQVRSQLLHT